VHDGTRTGADDPAACMLDERVIDVHAHERLRTQSLREHSSGGRCGSLDVRLRGA